MRIFKCKDSTELKIAFPVSVQLEMEDIAGEYVLQHVAEMSQKTPMKAALFVVKHGLSKHHNLDREAVLGILDENPELGEEASREFFASFGIDIDQALEKLTEEAQAKAKKKKGKSSPKKDKA